MTKTDALMKAVDRPWLDRLAEPLSEAVEHVYEAAGPGGLQVKNALHGVWLHHPLHPVFTDIPIGAWTTALALDTAANGDAGMRRAATFAMGVGLVGAVGAAVTGLTDWSETDGRSRRVGLVHGLMNIAATSLVAAAFVSRQADSHDNGRAFAWAGYAVALGAAFLGGDLVYSQRVGVTHAVVDEPEEFTRVADAAALAPDSMIRGRNGDVDVVIARKNGRLCALAHPCAHMGGPLSEGTLKDGSVVCPWHSSEFALDDGRVINGPATETQPSFDVREEGGALEVKARPRGAIAR